VPDVPGVPSAEELSALPAGELAASGRRHLDVKLGQYLLS
jgi:hypothetical protein